MTVLKLILALISLVRLLVTWAEQKKWMELGAAQAALKGLKDSDDAIQKAKSAREAVRSDLERNPDNVLRDDEFTRKD